LLEVCRHRDLEEDSPLPRGLGNADVKFKLMVLSSGKVKEQTWASSDVVDISVGICWYLHSSLSKTQTSERIQAYLDVASPFVTPQDFQVHFIASGRRYREKELVLA
jgi:hypothetical protein